MPGGPPQVQQAVRAGARGQLGDLAVEPPGLVRALEPFTVAGAEQFAQPLREQTAVPHDDGRPAGRGLDGGPQGALQTGDGLRVVLPAGEAHARAAGTPRDEHLLVRRAVFGAAGSVEVPDAQFPQPFGDTYGGAGRCHEFGGVPGPAEGRGPPGGRVGAGQPAQQPSRVLGLPDTERGEPEVRPVAGEDVVDVGRVLAVPHQVQTDTDHALPSPSVLRHCAFSATVPGRAGGPVGSVARPVRTGPHGSRRQVVNSALQLRFSAQFFNAALHLSSGVTVRRRGRCGRSSPTGVRRPPGRAPRTGSVRRPGPRGPAGPRCPRPCAF
ncbi:hypothetical protein OK074_7619 [Actinobacteria bacterium OK074]|nr:hypothetical protein OK074_7619 [Actinobacteria bacterium OK074]